MNSIEAYRKVFDEEPQPNQIRQSTGEEYDPKLIQRQVDTMLVKLLRMTGIVYDRDNSPAEIRRQVNLGPFDPEDGWSTYPAAWTGPRQPTLYLHPVVDWYVNCLGRVPDLEGFKYWTSLSHDADTSKEHEEIFQAFLSAAEANGERLTRRAHELSSGQGK